MASFESFRDETREFVIAIKILALLLHVSDKSHCLVTFQKCSHSRQLSILEFISRRIILTNLFFSDQWDRSTLSTKSNALCLVATAWPPTN